MKTKGGLKKGRNYKEGDLVLVYAHEGIYEAKILTVRKNTDRKTMPVLYFVHYQGWKNKWDEWITKEVMMENNKENKELRKEFMKRKEILRKRKLKQTATGHKSKKKREEEDSIVEDDPAFEYIQAEEESQNIFKLNMSEGFKNMLVKDWERITQQKKLVEVPKKVHVHAVLQRVSATYLHLLLSKCFLFSVFKACAEQKVDRSRRKSGASARARPRALFQQGPRHNPSIPI